MKTETIDSILQSIGLESLHQDLSQRQQIKRDLARNMKLSSGTLNTRGVRFDGKRRANH